jgi:DNA end-binding protein Ku
MPRAIWSGSISFGLVNVPVKLHTATEEKDIHFNQFQERTGHRIRMKRVSEETGREVDYEDIVKGYEVSKGKFVIVTPDELESVDPGPLRTIEIEDFVDLHEIDPIYFVKTYYVVPDKGEGATRAYALLREAMRRSDRVAIGRFVMRTKQYLVALRIVDDALALTTLYFSDEVRPLKDLDVPGKLKISEREMDIAMRLVDSLTTDWKPETYEDTYRERVLKLIKDKAKGKEIVVEEREQPGKVHDLLEALEASVKEARGKRTAAATKKRPAKKAAAKKTAARRSTSARKRKAA